MDPLTVNVDLKAHTGGPAGATFLLDFAFHDGISAIQTLARHFMGETDRVVRWVERSTFHITLVSSSLIDDVQVQRAIAALPREITAIPVALGPIDVFEQPDKTVIILRVQSSDALTALQKAVYDAVVAVGAPTDAFSKPEDWQPHVTLAYAQPGISAPVFSQTITATPHALVATRAAYYWVGGWTTLAQASDAAPSEPVLVNDLRSAPARPSGIRPAPTEGLIKAIIQKITRQQPFITDDSGFKVQGNRWFAWYTNNWYDLETEVFPVKAIDFYIQRVKGGEMPYPALWFSHLKSMPHGQADHLIRVGNMVLAAGTFDDSILAHRMKTYYRAAQKRGVRFRVSHGFKYATRFKIRGAYYLYETYEISPIPEVGSFRAANPYTSWEVKTMNIPDELRREIAAALSDDGKTINDTSLQRADSVIADAKSEIDKAASEGRQQKNVTTPDDVAARVEALEKSVGDTLTKFQTAFDDKMSKALTAFETGVKTNLDTVKAFEGVETKLKTFDERLKAIEDWQKQQSQLAPAPTRSLFNQLPADSPIALQLSGLEAASKNQSAPPSLVEMLTGEKSAEIDAAVAAQAGGR